MNPRTAKAVIVVAMIAMGAIRAPYSQRARGVKVATKPTRRSSILPAFAVLAIVLPLLWVPGRTFSFADYPLTVGSLVVGITCLAGGLWLLYRAHADLGTNWSSTVQIREHQQLITRGVYRRVRHPMYSAYLLYALGQALLIPNWVMGPSTLVMLGTLIAFRIPDEERMMLATFGERYATYMDTTSRLVPGVW
jgi:protein-S-isoprenylcysteine O-methyltransferase Ste14